MTTDLSRIAESFVIARNSAFTYKGKSVDTKQDKPRSRGRYIVKAAFVGRVSTFESMFSYRGCKWGSAMGRAL